jgi:hypothetical protein
VLGKTYKCDDLMVAVAEEREVEDGEHRAWKEGNIFCVPTIFRVLTVCPN